MKKTRLFTLDIATGTFGQLFLYAKELMHSGGRIATVNPIMLSRALRDNNFFQILKEFELKIPDGVGIADELFKRGVKTDTLPGVELGKMLLNQKGVRLFLFGGKEGVVKEAAKRLKDEFLGIEIVGIQSGYNFCIEDLISDIKKSKPNLVYVCLGTPHQEILINDLFSAHPQAVYIGLGGSFDVYSGNKKRSPMLFRHLKLEWLFRIISEPKRLRQIPEIFYFVKKARIERKKLQKNLPRGG